MSPAHPSHIPGPDELPTVHVVAGVITDTRGRVLLARRAPGRELAGLWEFPGGKVEPGETPEAALARELEEELGIRIEVGAPLVTVPHLAPSRHLRLDVRHVAAWRGSAKGLEGQALAWVRPDKLPRYDMPAPDRPVVAALLQPDHCLVTPLPEQGEAAWLSALETALARGVRRVQLRLPGVEAGVRQRLLEGAAQRCAAAGADLLVNGDPDLARESGLGLHLPAARLREHGARPVPPEQLFSASCHDADELARAEALGCDFVLVGPVRATPSHPGQAGIGWQRFEALRERTALPIYAIGGLGPDDVSIARQHGAQGIAAIRGLWEGRA